MSPFWWLTSIRYFIYFIRELTGPVIAFYTAYFMIRWYFNPALSFINTPSFKTISWIGLMASIIHSLTWFWVTAKISPVSQKFRWIIAVFLIFFWVGLSAFLLNTFYFTDAISS